jgi:hypothetical protein
MGRWSKSALSETFNRKAEQIKLMTTNPWFMGACIGIGLVSLPFSSTAALMALSTPTVYYGIGLGFRIAGNALRPSGP